jgi:hypothetical protein
MQSMFSSAEAKSELPATQLQADDLDLVSLNRSLDSSMSELAISRQLTATFFAQLPH